MRSFHGVHCGLPMESTIFRRVSLDFMWTPHGLHVVMCWAGPGSKAWAWAGLLWAWAYGDAEPSPVGGLGLGWAWLGLGPGLAI